MEECYNGREARRETTRAERALEWFAAFAVLMLFCIACD
jgi:hypothetical protein